jgi:DNA mismatch endonuclease, patch repair protein
MIRKPISSGLRKVKSFQRTNRPLAMVDVFSKRKRSDVMSRIRSQGNRDTELALIRLFRTHGITGWRRQRPLAGKPDFVFPAKRLAIFVDGCFWHGCEAHSKPPKSNCEYWSQKLLRNQQRDRIVNAALRNGGWRVLRLWEHDLARRNENHCLRRILSALAKP